MSSKVSSKSGPDWLSSKVGSLAVLSSVWRLKAGAAVGGRVTKVDVCVVFSSSFVAEFKSGLKKELGFKVEAVVELENNDDIFWPSVADDPL